MGPLEAQIWRLLKWPGHSLLFSKPSCFLFLKVSFVPSLFSFVCQLEEMINGLNWCLKILHHVIFVCIRFLLEKDGLFLGSSSAMNCVGAVRVAQSVGPGHTIVTILCDSGMRHLSKFHNAKYLSELGLTPKATGLEFLGIK